MSSLNVTQNLSFPFLRVQVEVSKMETMEETGTSHRSSDAQNIQYYSIGLNLIWFGDLSSQSLGL